MPKLKRSSKKCSAKLNIIFNSIIKCYLSSEVLPSQWSYELRHHHQQHRRAVIAEHAHFVINIHNIYDLECIIIPTRASSEHLINLWLVSSSIFRHEEDFYNNHLNYTRTRIIKGVRMWTKRESFYSTRQFNNTQSNLVSISSQFHSQFLPSLHDVKTHFRSETLELQRKAVTCRQDAHTMCASCFFFATETDTQLVVFVIE